jgi:lactonase
MSHKMQQNSVMPLPPELKALPTIVAEPWLTVDESPPGLVFKGPAFDRLGNLFLSSIYDGRIYKVTTQKKISVIFENKNILHGCIAFHKDGRLFDVCLSGEVMTMNPDGSDINYINTRYQGKPKVINGLVFDRQGNLYVTDNSGTGQEQCGGVYRFSADFKTVQPVVEHLARSNGISFSPEGNVLWIAEDGRNAVIRLELLADGVTLHPQQGFRYAYYSTGAPGAPNQNKVDAEGNLYQCIFGQGRVVILNKYAIPIANVVVPGRDEGKHLRTPNLAFKPGTNEAFLISGEDGIWVYKFRGLAEGLPLFSHQ